MRQAFDPVPNQFPAVEPSGSARVAILGGFPDHDDCYFGAPLSGEKGRLLEGALGHVGIARNQCFVGNILQVSPPGMRMESLAWDGPEVQGGIAQLRCDLEKFRPTIVLCLGNEALHLMRQGNVAPPRRGKDYAWPASVMDWRGSLFASDFVSVRCASNHLIIESSDGCALCEGGESPVKCLAAIHPSWVLRDYSLQAYYRTGVGGLGDLERLREESGTRELGLPQRMIVVGNDAVCAVVQTLRAYVKRGKALSVDIEGHPGNVTSIAFAIEPGSAFVVPFARADGSNLWSEDEEIELWQAVRELLEDGSIPKIFQNGQYDTFALAWTYGIVVHGWQHDTMLSMWETFCELKKGLPTQTSLFTREPFYKPDKEDGELKFASDEQFWRYNGLDACVTFECWQGALKFMTPGQRAHYEFNCSLLPAVLGMMLRGIKFDQEAALAEQEKALKGAWELQALIDKTVALEPPEGNDLDLLYNSSLDEVTFAGMVLRCLGGKNPRVKVTMTEERWQPMRWNGKKWVRDGKMVTGGIAAECYSSVEQPPVQPGDIRVLPWLKPMPRQIERLQPFTPATLADCDPHILESKRGEWRRVRQLWKELRYANQRRLDGSVAEQASGDKANGSETERAALSTGTDAGLPSSTSALLGELSTLLGLSVNVGSTNEGGDAQRFLFEVCGLPRIYKCERSGRLSREPESAYKKRRAGEKAAIPAGKRLSTDQAALDKLYAETEDVRVLWCLQLRRLRMAASNLGKEIDPDSRIRSSISLVKETGRMAASKSPTGTGTNLQSWDKDHRHVCVADEGCLMGQCDLEGADSWTVAAECAALGDPTMLEDLLAGLKPAKVICAIHLVGAEVVNGWTRDEIKIALKELKQPDWLYPGAKAVCHGSSYGAGYRTVIDTLLKNSMSDLPLELSETKPVMLTKAQVEKLQGAFFSRYPGVKLWHAKMERVLLTTGMLETSVGHVRRLYGRKTEIKQGRKVANHETKKEALSSLPQFYTTYQTKKALWNLWHDPLNRKADGSLVIEPLIPVHDSLAFQFPRESLTETREAFKRWFSGTVMIANQKISIPSDFCYGPDWSCKNKS